MKQNETPPEPRPVRWGIIGTGTIATAFAQDILLVPEANLVAVCSRSLAKGSAFAGRFGEIRAYDDPASMASDVDAIYIASPNMAHYEQAHGFLSMGKPVLVEKPLVTSAEQARTLAALASRTGTFAMEAMWTAYLPAVEHVRNLLSDAAIGRITGVTAELAYRKPFDPGSRFFSPELGGGALFDLGIYPIALMLTLFGLPQSVMGHWTAAATGVDMSARATLSYDGFDADFSCGFDRDGGNRFIITGDTGSLIIDAPFLKASRIHLARNSFARRLAAPAVSGRISSLAGKIASRLPVPGLQSFDHAFPGNGLQFEIAAASRAIRAGLREEKRMPLTASIAALEIIEKIRAVPAS